MLKNIIFLIINDYILHELKQKSEKLQNDNQYRVHVEHSENHQHIQKFIVLSRLVKDLNAFESFVNLGNSVFCKK